MATAAVSAIPLLDLRAQYQAIKPEIDAAIQHVLERGQYILGPEVAALEREVAEYCGAAYAIGVASGTDALELALRACGVGPGHDVLTTAYSFFATAEAIVTVGATPIFLDIEPATNNLDPEQLAQRITPRTKAILPVHLYGHPCNMHAVLRVAAQHKLAVIEDCAQAIGASTDGRRIGALGDAGAFSFFPSKNLGGYGDGGMVVTNRPEIAEQVQLLRAHGSRERYWHLVLGRNSRLDELQAAILRVKLRHLDEWTEQRRQHAERYRHAFAARGLSQIVVPSELAGYRHVYHQYCIRISGRRDRVRQALVAAGIGCQVYYPSTLPEQPALAQYVSGQPACPQADAAVRELLALPIFPELTQAQINRIADCIASALAS